MTFLRSGAALGALALLAAAPSARAQFVPVADTAQGVSATVGVGRPAGTAALSSPLVARIGYRRGASDVQLTVAHDLTSGVDADGGRGTVHRFDVSVEAGRTVRLGPVAVRASAVVGGANARASDRFDVREVPAGGVSGEPLPGFYTERSVRLRAGVGLDASALLAESARRRSVVFAQVRGDQAVAFTGRTWRTACAGTTCHQVAEPLRQVTTRVGVQEEWRLPALLGEAVSLVGTLGWEQAWAWSGLYRTPASNGRLFGGLGVRVRF